MNGDSELLTLFFRVRELIRFLATHSGMENDSFVWTYSNNKAEVHCDQYNLETITTLAFQINFDGKTNVYFAKGSITELQIAHKRLTRTKQLRTDLNLLYYKDQKTLAF